jgi:hypothetical protein
MLFKIQVNRLSVDPNCVAEICMLGPDDQPICAPHRETDNAKAKAMTDALEAVGKLGVPYGPGA